VTTQLYIISIDPRPVGDGVQPWVRISEEFLDECSVKVTFGIGTARKLCTPNNKIIKKGLLRLGIIVSLLSPTCPGGVEDNL
jgi:hypothetical protein